MSYLTFSMTPFSAVCRRLAVVLVFLGNANGTNDSKPIKVVETAARKNVADVLVYTTDKPRMRILLSCQLDTINCKVPTAGDKGLYFPALDDTVYAGPNGCIVFDYPGDAAKNTGCYAVQSTSVE
jgi:hypothetical protein